MQYEKHPNRMIRHEIKNTNGELKKGTKWRHSRIQYMKNILTEIIQHGIRNTNGELKKENK